MEIGRGNSDFLHCVSPVVKHQKELESQPAPINIPKEGGKSWRGEVGKKCLNGNETKAKNHTKKWKDFGKKKMQSKCNPGTNRLPPMKGKLWVSCLEWQLSASPPLKKSFESYWSLVLNRILNFLLPKISQIYKRVEGLYKESLLPMPASAVTDILPTCISVSLNGILNLWFSF